jgi:hypothetical protein
MGLVSVDSRRGSPTSLVMVRRPLIFRNAGDLVEQSGHEAVVAAGDAGDGDG